MTVLAALYTRQAGRWFRAYYQKGDEALPKNVASSLNSDRSSTAKLRAIASLYNIPWCNARGHGKHRLNQQI